MPQAAWRVLQTRFDDGLRFFELWRAWQLDDHRPTVLHVVALTPLACTTQALQHAVADFPQLMPLASELARQWVDLTPGFHRLELDGGRVMLTLCVGPLQAQLRELQFLADAVELTAAPHPTLTEASWDAWQLKALARCCRRGTQLSVRGLAEPLRQGLVHVGFDVQADAVVGMYNPPWDIKRTRSPWAQPARDEEKSCVVIGAGLAGASVAAALARRGWQVTVLDTAARPAMAASGLPAGLMVPHVSADDSPRSRLSRNGIRLTLGQAQRLLQAGQDWAMTGVMEMRPGAAARWHARAGWVKPVSLVHAWLDHPGIAFQGSARVFSLRREGHLWHAAGSGGETLAVASQVVLANANGLPDVLGQVPGAPALSLAAVHGQVSWAHQRDEAGLKLPPYPVNGHGHLLAHVPMGSGAAWFVGASFELEGRPRASIPELHAANLTRLQTLLPAAGAALTDDFASTAIQAWTQARCVSHDRLPFAGPLAQGDQTSGLWVSAAMGSRGLSFAVLCAEVVAAQMNGEPLPVEASLARHLHPSRRKMRASPHEI